MKRETCVDESRGRCRKAARWYVDGYALCDQHADVWAARYTRGIKRSAAAK